jgi:hypothetical protein
MAVPLRRVPRIDAPAAPVIALLRLPDYMVIDALTAQPAAGDCWENRRRWH